MQIVEPDIGCWYKSKDSDIEFEVVALDDENVDIQYFDGEIEEIDRESWYSMGLYEIPAPEDWSGPYEMEQDELPQDEAFHPHQWDMLASGELDNDKYD